MKAIELFAGAGGSAIGAAAGGVTDLLTVDSSPIKVQTLEANRGLFKKLGCNLTALEADLFRIPVQEIISKAELVIGGAPCQPFSNSGKREGFSDPRNGLLCFFKYVTELQPRFFLLENVPGLIHSRFTKSLAQCISTTFSSSLRDTVEWIDAINYSNDSLVTKDYEIHASLLNAADFGIAQIRKRVFIAGVRRGVGHKIDWQWPNPTHSQAGLVEFLKSGAYRQSHSIINTCVPDRVLRSMLAADGRDRWMTVRDTFSLLGSPLEKRKNIRHFGHYFRPGARSYPGHRGSWLDWPSKTIKAGVHGVPGGENMALWPNGRIRYFTLLECSALQGFPVNYEFPGNFREALSSIGNAVPPALVSSIVRNYVQLSRAAKKVTSLDCGQLPLRNAA